MGGLVISCSSIKKADLESTNPQTAFNEVYELKKNLEAEQVDLLAHGDYTKGLEELEDARKELTTKKFDAKDVLEDLGEAKAYFNRAKTTATNIANNPTEVLKTRKFALAQDVHSTESLKTTLESIDEDLRDETDEFKKTLSAMEVSDFQKKYQQLEVMGVQNTELKTFRSIVMKAEKNDAEELAPETLRKTKVALLSAENSIAQNPRVSDNYKDEVLEANKATKLLDDVMNKLLGEAKGSPEKVAVKLVMQEREVGKLSATVGTLQGNLAETQKNLTEMSENLSNQVDKRLSAEAQVRFQEAMDEVRNNFDSNEAEVYQQGDRLILRLKQLNFASGSAEIPETSTGLLAKIGSIIKNIEPTKIEVQGHTDSTGTKTINEKLSLERAKSVEQFFVSRNQDLITETVGYGEMKPITTNTTVEGRATNRRVDIVIDAK